MSSSKESTTQKIDADAKNFRESADNLKTLALLLPQLMNLQESNKKSEELRRELQVAKKFKRALEKLGISKADLNPILLTAANVGPK